MKHCRECGDKFPESELEHHELTHIGATYKRPIEQIQAKQLTPVSNYKCKQCNQTFKYEKDWMTHEKSHKQAENKRRLKCSKCDRTFSSLIDLKTHESTHKSKETQKETPFYCGKCEQNFKDRFSHSEHTCSKIQERLIKSSQTEKLFCCSTCDKEFGRKDDLKRHERTHRIQHEPRKELREQRASNKLFSCDVCEVIFNTEEDLQSHEKSHTCPHYKISRCMFGPRGENDKGSCKYSHPKRCIYDRTVGCKKPDCSFFHTETSRTSHSAVPPVNNNFNSRSHQSKGPNNNMAFLGQREVFQLLDRYFQQKMDQDPNNNAKGRGFHKGRNWQ